MRPRASSMTRERIFYIVVFCCSTSLLLSIAMLRDEIASSPSSSSTFRDGIIVASRLLNPVENNAIELIHGKKHETTIIKTEDGDDITIKHAPSNRKHITHISSHENGTITIEKQQQEQKVAQDSNSTGSSHMGIPVVPPTIIIFDNSQAT